MQLSHAKSCSSNLMGFVTCWLNTNKKSFIFHQTPPFQVGGATGHETSIPLAVCNCDSLHHFVEYHFTNREEMQRSIDAGEFIEWAEYSGNLYGTRYIMYVAVSHCQLLTSSTCCVCAAYSDGQRRLNHFLAIRQDLMDVLTCIKSVFNFKSLWEISDLVIISEEQQILRRFAVFLIAKDGEQDRLVELSVAVVLLPESAQI